MSYKPTGKVMFLTTSVPLATSSSVMPVKSLSLVSTTRSSASANWNLSFSTPTMADVLTVRVRVSVPAVTSATVITYMSSPAPPLPDSVMEPASGALMVKVSSDVVPDAAPKSLAAITAPISALEMAEARVLPVNWAVAAVVLAVVTALPSAAVASPWATTCAWAIWVRAALASPLV